MNRWLCWTLTAAWAVSGAAQAQEAIRQNPGFQSRFIERNDDGSSRLEALGFTINFFGKLRSAAYVNNNGNLTFDEDLSTFTPFGLLNTDREIIAPFFADVDTRPAGSNVVTYGQDTVNGHRAFGANYVNVGYYSNHTDKLNSFQVVLIEREDQGPGDFDIEFNYERISWETGDASDGVDGFGGTPAAVGWSNGSETAFELPGSRVPGSFLDGGPYALVSQNITGRVFNTSSQSQLGRTGRLVFRARDGVISPGIVISGGLFPDGTMAVPYSQSLTVQGADPPYSWTLQPDVAPLPGLSLSPAGVLSGTPTAAGTYNFTLGVKAQTEDGEVTVYERGSLTIHPPELRITSACPLPDGRVGSPYLFNFAATGSSTSYTWRILDPETVPLGMGLSNSGLFAGTPQLPGTYMVYVQASATGNPDAKPAALKCRLNVNPARLQLTADNCFLPKATQGVPYSVQLDGQGGDGPYRFELIYSLPQGLALTQDGLLAGTPSYYGVYPFKIATNDSKGGRTVQDCALTVEPAPFFTSACPLPSGTTGVPYSTTLPGSYTWSVIGSLPAGLTLSPTGQISGTPMVGGPHYFRLLATDSGNKQSAEPCSLVIERGPLSVTGCPLPSARTGEPYQASVIGSGGAAPYMFTTQGTMPAGLSMSTSGVVSGTPTQAGEFPFSVVLRDANYATKVQACQLTVQTSKLHLTNACPLPAGRTGQAYSSQLEAAGGTAPYQYLIAGYLPDGLTLSSSGAITGMPQRIGSRKFTIYTVDASGAYVPQDCSLDVGSPVAPEVSLGNLPTTVAPAVTNLSIPVQLADPAAAAVTGKVVMQVTPNTLSSNAVANSADPRLAFANGQTTATFTIPAGSSSTSLPVVSTGTVASTVTVSLADLRSSGSPLGQYPVAKTFQIAASAPTITSACYARPSTLEIEFRVNGISNTRELKRAVVTIPGVTITHYAIPPVPEFTITNRDEATIDLRNLSLAYYSSPVNVRTGGAFGLTFVLPVDIATDVVFNDVTLDVFNSAGGAGKRTIQACP